MALSKLPKTFGQAELIKGYFPHLFNMEENQSYVGDLPAQDFYCPDSMSIEVREHFLSWYERRKLEQFDFRKEILLYCRSDVDILRRCCLEFRTQFIATSGVDPFCYITIASACMACYRSSHMQNSTIAMVPTQGYANEGNYSRDSIRWLDFVAAKDNISIRHALNGLGEAKICGLRAQTIA